MANDALVGEVLLLPDDLVVVGSLFGEPAIWKSADGDAWQMQAEGTLGQAGHLAEAWRSVPVGGATADELLLVAVWSGCNGLQGPFRHLGVPKGRR